MPRFAPVMVTVVLVVGDEDIVSAEGYGMTRSGQIYAARYRLGTVEPVYPQLLL